MKAHSLLIRTIGLLTIFAAVISACLALAALATSFVSIPDETGGTSFVYKFGAPDITQLFFVWRSGTVLKWCREIMLGLSLLGGIKIASLLAKNREKLRGKENRRIIA